MELGTGLFTCQKRPDDDRSTAEIYDEMLELGEAIDEAGLDSAWVSEHHFLEDGYLSGVVPARPAPARPPRGSRPQGSGVRTPRRCRGPPRR